MKQMLSFPLSVAVRSTTLALGIATTLCASMIGTPNASAAVVVSLNDNAPTENIIKYNAFTNTPANITTYWRGPGGSDQVKTAGQGFSTVGNDTPYLLTAVTFNIIGFSPEVQGLGFSLSITSSDAVGTLPTAATPVSTQTGNLPNVLITDSYITFTLDTPVLLEPGKYYNVIYAFTEKTAENSDVKHLSFRTTGTGVANTSGGRRWIGVDGVYTAAAPNSFVFYAHATPVPEPTTYVLLGGALVGLGIRRHLRNSRAHE